MTVQGEAPVVRLDMVKDEKTWAGVHISHFYGRIEGEYPWRVHCDRPHCEFVVHRKTEEQAYDSYDNHKCPYVGGTRTYGWGITVIALDKIWAKLDALVLDLYEGGLEPEQRRAVSYQARGIAEALCVMMVPHFDTPEKISAEAKVRYEKRKAGEKYDTPGLAELRYKTSSDRMPVLGHRGIDTSNLSDETRSTILNGKGYFTADQLAPALGLSPQIIKAVWAQAG